MNQYPDMALLPWEVLFVFHAYRNEVCHRKIGGTTFSRHSVFTASDFSVSGVPVKEVKSLLVFWCNSEKACPSLIFGYSVTKLPKPKKSMHMSVFRIEIPHTNQIS